MLGKGSYDKEHDDVHKLTGATSSILIVLNGYEGHGFSVKATQNHIKALPHLLREVADKLGPEIEKDLEQIEAIKKGRDDTGQSFAG